VSSLGPKNLKISLLSNLIPVLCATRNAAGNEKNQNVPNVMAVLSNIGGGLCSTPQSLAEAQYRSAVQ